MGYTTNDLRKGLKIQINGEPYVVVECDFYKPGKGQAKYRLKVKNLLKNTVTDKNYRSGEAVEAADVMELDTQYLYRQGDKLVFMENDTYEQYEIPEASIKEEAKFLIEGMIVQTVLWNGNPISITPPNHVVLKVTYCEPGAKGNTATNVVKPCTMESGVEVNAPSFINIGDNLRIDTRTGDYIERVNLKE